MVSLSPLSRSGKEKKDSYRFEIGNSTFGLWELPGTIVEAMMGHDEETRIIYDANDRVLAIEGYTPPEPTGALKEAIEAQEKQRVPSTGTGSR